MSAPEQKTERWAKIPELEMRAWATVAGGNGVAVLCVLRLHASTKTHKAWPSIQTIAELSGASQSTVKRVLASAEKAGLIVKSTKKVRRPGRPPNLYEICPVPADLEERVSVRDEPKVSGRDEPKRAGISGRDEPLNGSQRTVQQVVTNRELTTELTNEHTTPPPPEEEGGDSSSERGVGEGTLVEKILALRDLASHYDAIPSHCKPAEGFWALWLPRFGVEPTVLLQDDNGVTNQEALYRVAELGEAIDDAIEAAMSSGDWDEMIADQRKGRKRLQGWLNTLLGKYQRDVLPKKLKERAMWERIAEEGRQLKIQAAISRMLRRLRARNHMLAAHLVADAELSFANGVLTVSSDPLLAKALRLHHEDLDEALRATFGPKAKWALSEAA